MTEATRSEYCRRCGDQTERRIPEGDSRPRATCGRCGAIEYDNPKVVVAAALYEGDRILWARRAIPPYAGRWALPGGFVELGETLAEATCREVLEETHVKISADRLTLFGVLSLPDLEQIYIALAAPLPAHDYGPSAEASEVCMISRDEIGTYDLAYPDVTLEYVLRLYDAIGRGELERGDSRAYVIRGVDPTAVLNS